MHSAFRWQQLQNSNGCSHSLDLSSLAQTELLDQEVNAMVSVVLMSDFGQCCECTGECETGCPASRFVSTISLLAGELTVLLGYRLNEQSETGPDGE